MPSCPMLSGKTGEVTYASILHEVPEEGGDPEPETDQDEEWQAGHTGRVPEVRHQGVPNREGIALESQPGSLTLRGD